MKRFMLLLLTIPLAAADPFAVQVSGNPKGPSVLLIPGLSSSGDVWRETVAHLAPKYQCHVFTLAGFAGQPRFGDGPFLAAAKDAIAAYIEKNKLDKPIVIGHSLGGHMALWLASDKPGSTGPLVIVDSLPHLGAMMNPDPAALRKQAEGMRLMIGAQTKEQYGSYIKSSKMLESLVGPRGIEEVTQWSLSSDPLAVANAMFDLYTTDLRDPIAKIEVPTLVFSTWIGYKDYSTREQTLANVEQQFNKLRHKTILMAATAKHFLMLDEQQWFFDKLDAFLAQ